MEVNKIDLIKNIKQFLEGRNNDIKYVVNVEVNPDSNIASCIVHEPDGTKKIVEVIYEPFLFMKDLSLFGRKLYDGWEDSFVERKKIEYGITITKLKTDNQERLVKGYSYKISSSKSFNHLLNFLSDGGVNPYEKLKNNSGKIMKDKHGSIVYPNKEYFFIPKLVEQFFISTKIRLFKGYENYNQLHRLVFDIETTSLRYENGRVFAIGVRDNKGFETILKVEKFDDNESEKRIIVEFFELINKLKPTIIAGYNSEMFDFEFLLGRAKILGIDFAHIPIDFKNLSNIKRVSNSLKYGSNVEKYTATEIWGYSIIDVLHAVKRTSAINSDIKENGLKYIANFEGVSKPDRVYIDGEESLISKYYRENKIFVLNEINNYIQVPDEFQNTAKQAYYLQENKNNIKSEKYDSLRKKILSNKNFIEWLTNVALKNKYNRFICGEKLVERYLLDDLWETEKIDELYNQTSFMLAKIVPTTYSKITTIGTASIWNLLMIAWSYENNLAIPYADNDKSFSGGLVRCYKRGYAKNLVKLDYKSLYPSIQLSENVFPHFDITGVLKKLLIYFKTTRELYKNLSENINLSKEDLDLLKIIDNDVYYRYIDGNLTENDYSMFKTKQLPIKILNNSLFGGLGSGKYFNWSDNNCAAKITCVGRLFLRKAIHYFNSFGCVPLLAVTDGINFQIPEKTNIYFNNNEVRHLSEYISLNEAWNYNDKKGIMALIEKYNVEELGKTDLRIEFDGEYVSCFNLSRINYALLYLTEDKKTKKVKEKIKLVGNTIKSKVMPEYIEEFIDNGLKLILHGKGKEFVEYYYDYCDDIRYMRIPLKKIASKSKVKCTINEYLNRGKDKNGREKAMQAHMELLIEERKKIAEELFEMYKHEFQITSEELSVEEKMSLVSKYMPPEPDIDSTVYYYNTGTRKSHGDVKKDPKTKKTVLYCKKISYQELVENPNMTGQYNYKKYLHAFNSRVKSLLVAFKPEISNKILVSFDKNDNLIKNEFTSYELELNCFDLDNFDESMHLSEAEVDFWNKTGYDPRLIWNGFKLFDDKKIYYEIYENALKYLNELMIQNNKPPIKSINSKYDVGDLVLVKDGSRYHIAKYNGVYLKHIKYDVNVPKSEFEIELDKKISDKEKMIENLKLSTLLQKTNRELYLENLNKRRELYFEEFKIKYNIPNNITMDLLFKEIPKSLDAFNDFVDEKEYQLKKEALEYGIIDDSENDFYYDEDEE